PNGGLVLDGSGNLFGTTADGGASGAGTVFEAARGWQPLPPVVFVTGADAGGGPDVRVFVPGSSTAINAFLAYNAGFVGGVRVAVGDINADGTPDILCGAGPGGGSDIKVFSGVDGHLLREFSPYNPLFTDGQYLASADINGDGFDDIVVGADAGGGPNV